jgi:KDO2-lipid IV(A) lauroyltransferase
MTVRHDSGFWRRAAAFGARRGPHWFLRYSPPVIGVLWCAALPRARHAVEANLVRVRGDRGKVRNTLDAARTFATFAGCLAETLAVGSPNEIQVHSVLEGEENFRDALADGHGMVIATLHTAGWEATGSSLTEGLGVEVVVAMQRERDAAARALQDEAREARGVHVVHVGADPLEALPLLSHLKKGGAVALQIDRPVHGMRMQNVTLFDAPSQIPEGPLRLAQLSGAPIVPVFSARVGYRRYFVVAEKPVRVTRRASDGEIAKAAQSLANAFESFVRAHPTQWLTFEPLTAEAPTP